jgi:hypothetical protein
VGMVLTSCPFGGYNTHLKSADLIRELEQAGLR